MWWMDIRTVKFSPIPTTPPLKHHLLAARASPPEHVPDAVATAGFGGTPSTVAGPSPGDAPIEGDLWLFRTFVERISNVCNITNKIQLLSVTVTVGTSNCRIEGQPARAARRPKGGGGGGRRQRRLPDLAAAATAAPRSAQAASFIRVGAHLERSGR